MIMAEAMFPIVSLAQMMMMVGQIMDNFFQIVKWKLLQQTLIL
jgi:hypothetical protein